MSCTNSVCTLTTEGNPPKNASEVIHKKSSTQNQKSMAQKIRDIVLKEREMHLTEC